MVESAAKGTALGTSREDYLAGIYRLQSTGQSVGTGDVAQRLGISPASTSAMFKRLVREGLVQHESYGDVCLTEEGARLAAAVVRRHRILERFLTDVLGIGWDEVDAYADRMEHAVPDEVLTAMEGLLGAPATCPHGYPIPVGGELAPADGQPLSALRAGERAVVRRVDESDPKLLRYLRSCGLVPGAALEVRERNDVDGTRVLSVAEQTIVVGPRIAEALAVEAVAELEVCADGHS